MNKDLKDLGLQDAHTREHSNETREDYVCTFIWDWQTWPRRCYQCGELEGKHQ